MEANNYARQEAMDNWQEDSGVDLRDYFAAKVLHALAVMPRATDTFGDGMFAISNAAITSYAYADAMLHARDAETQTASPNTQDGNPIPAGEHEARLRGSGIDILAVLRRARAGFALFNMNASFLDAAIDKATGAK